MKINVGQAYSQANRIRDYAQELNEIKSRLQDFKGNLNSGWQAQEMTYINNAINSISREISELQTLLFSIGPDIVAAANEIKREEEAREAAERAAAERAAKEREARLNNTGLR
ncbi:WXG100 family type VII secretion target [Mesobacillus jeotgali]|jgi:uncharacterized protein YukE|uniref:WXG100 family type VII secretion target n=1 Tax=Mesobacillus jeotgali TaxID=129985 RepID=A0ABY9VGS1_9BACI|nr:WXG100 family type VII secretion target [Mesobacillus jeotgali]WNF22778.1 hypothetical protein RH061_21930 [Mesobacillus jeotgali]